jgi:serine/threonine-protein kinase
MVQDNLCGTVLGNKYELLEVIGSGGMGLVYRARHNMMNRIVAIKVLNKAHITDTASLKRFQIEAQAASALSMPHVLTVFDFGVAIDGQPYMVMDLLQGPSLDKVLETEGKLSTERALRICIQVCDGLAHAHSKGIIHRDIKPSNIILVQNEEQPDFVKIVDFGIAKLLNPTDPELAGLTRTGEVFGSPLYMSPEQWHAQKLDARTDIYSLGAVMYRTLCGRFMFDKSDVVQLMYKHISQMPRPFADFGVDVPESVEAIVFKALAKQPDNRFQSMSEMSQALRYAYANLGKEPSEREIAASAETATRLFWPANDLAGQSAAPLVEASNGDSTASGATTGPLIRPTMTESGNVTGINNKTSSNTGGLNQPGTFADTGNTGRQAAPAGSTHGQMVPTSLSSSQSIIPGAFAAGQAVPLHEPAAGNLAQKKQPVDRKRKIIILVLSVWSAGVVAFAVMVISGHKKTAPEQAEIPGTIPAPVNPQKQTPPAQAVVSPKPPDAVAPPVENVLQKPPLPVHAKSALRTQPRPQAGSTSEPAHEHPVEAPGRAEPRPAKPSKKARITSEIKQAFKHLLRKL